MALSFSFRHAIPPSPPTPSAGAARMRKATKRGKSEEVLLPLQCSLSSHVMYSFIVAAPFVSASQFMTWEGATKDPLLVAAVAASLNAAAVFLLQCQMNSFINVPPTKGVDNVTEVRWARGICRSFLPPSLPPATDHRRSSTLRGVAAALTHQAKHKC